MGTSDSPDRGVRPWARRAWAVGVAALAAAATCLAGTASAQSTFPSHAVRLVVPFAPGGGVDEVARALAQSLGERLGQPFIVDNRPGASTVVGSLAVLHAVADGYTLLIASSSFTTASSLSKNLPFDAARDFVPVSMVANAAAVLAVNASSPARSLADFIALARSRPGEITCANFGNGTTPHLVAELFQQMTGVRFLDVPYNGGGPAVMATISGQTVAVFPTALPVLTQYKAGRLRLLAIASRTRSSSLPDVPTFAEQGVPLETGTWFGLVAPAGTPPEVVARLNAAVASLESDQVFRKRLQAAGAEFDPGPQAGFAAFLKSDQLRWRRVIDTAHIVAD